MTVCGTGGWSGPLPGDPDNNSILSAVPAFGGIDVSYTWPTVNSHAVAYAKLYRGITDVFEQAVHSTVMQGNTYYDKLDSGIQYWYWIEIVSTNGTVSPVIGPATAIARPLINDLLAQLTAKIDAGVLAASLKGEIDKITLNYSDLSQQILDLSGDDAALSLALANLQTGVADALTLILDETNARQTGQAAMIEQIDAIGVLNANTAAAVITNNNASVDRDSANADRIEAVLATVGNDLAAAVQTLNQAIVDGDILLAQQVNTVQTTAADNLASAQLTLQTNIDLVGDKATAIGSLLTAKLSVNGLVGGFGVYNDGTEVEAGFDVDRFWIGRTGADLKKPFIIQDGEVFINEAAINTLTITKLRDESGQVVVENGGLAIRDALGNVIFSAGTPLDWSRINGAAKPQDGATRNVYRGVWATNTAYAAGDIVIDAGYGWSCAEPHLSSAVIKPPTYPVASNAYWILYTVKGDQGPAGVNGTRTAVLDMYKNSVAAPTSFPSGDSTYTWTTGQFTAPAVANGWSLTPPAPVVGQDLYVVRQLYSDNATSTTSVVGWAATTSRISAASGEPGQDGINGARTAFAELYLWAANTPTVFPAGTSTYTWATGAFTAPTTPNGWSLVPGAAVPGYTLWACSVRLTNNTTVTTDTLTWNTNVAYAIGAAGVNGSNAVTALVSNEAHVFPALSDGTVASYANSGTQIRVYEGSTELVYDGVGTANGTWKVASSVPSNIAVGTITDSGTFVTFENHSGVAAGTDVSSIVYTLSGKSLTGVSFSLTKQQSFTKSKAGVAGTNGTNGTNGATGPQGPSVVLVSNRPTTFTSTDGTLDGSQTNIVFTANTTGIASPTYAWSFSGLQTNPTASTTNTQTITAAQFGTSKSAIVTCTVNGTIVDKATIVRLEKSTAEAGATVGAPPGTVVGSTPAEDVEARANAVTTKLDKASTEILNIDAASAIRVAGIRIGDLVWNSSGVRTSGKGVGLTPAGLQGHNGTKVTFAINAVSGDATFGGDLAAATGTFSGTMTADAVNAVNTINIAGNSVTVPASAYTSGSISLGTSFSTIQSLSINIDGGISIPVVVSASFSLSGATVSQFRILRGADVIYTSGEIMQGTDGINKPTTPISISIVDFAATGSYSYYLQARYVSGYSARSASTRTLTALGVKR